MIAPPWRMALLTPALLIGFTTGCGRVPSYIHEPFDPGSVVVIPIDDAVADSGSPLEGRWTTALGYCRFRQVGMSRELEDWSAVERKQRRFFGGLGFFVGLGTTLYATIDDSPDPTAIAVAGALGILSSVPAFLASGPQDRRAELTTRLGRVAAARAAVDQANVGTFNAYAAFGRACQTMRDRGATADELRRSGCTVPDSYVPGATPLQGEELVTLQSAASRAYFDWDKARMDLSLALDQLMATCDQGT